MKRNIITRNKTIITIRPLINCKILLQLVLVSLDRKILHVTQTSRLWENMRLSTIIMGLTFHSTCQIISKCWLSTRLDYLAKPPGLPLVPKSIHRVFRNSIKTQMNLIYVWHRPKDLQYRIERHRNRE